MEEPPRKTQRRSVFVQSGRCRDTNWLLRRMRIPSSCVTCICWRKYGIDAPCRFQGFRKLRHTSSGVLEEDGFDEGEPAPMSNVYPDANIFDNNPSETDISDLQLVVAQALKPILVEELKVHSNLNLVFRHLEKDLVACDVCNTSILFSSWFCTECAQEICDKCFRDGNWQADCTIAISCHHELRACSRIRTTELKATLNLLEPICTRSPPLSSSHPETPHTHKCRTEAEKQRITPRLAPKHLDAFQVLWPLGIPISVDLPQNADYEPYSVENLRTHHGKEEALVSCCDFSPQKAGWRWKSAVMQVRWYLMAFARSETEDGPNLVIKIEELPQHESLASTYPLECAHYLNIIPFPLYTSPIGYFNLASHYALDQPDHKITKPNLGPKLHLSTSRTYLHSITLRVSMTGTQYVLVSRDQTRQNVASWTIFRREDTPQLREFLAQEHPRCGYDIINARTHFLDQEDLRKLRERKVVPYTAVQKPGVAVIIPPGCVYQAKTIGNIIQVTSSFVDQHTIGAVLELRDEWRKHRLPDTVQIKWVLWHAWHSLLALKDAREKAPPQANPDLTARASKRLKTRIYHCPHAGCKGNRRMFAVPSIFDHLKASHDVDLTDSERALLSEKAPDEWAAEFERMMLKSTSVCASASGDEPGDPIVISSSP